MITTADEELSHRVIIKLDTPDPIKVADVSTFLTGVNGFYALTKHQGPSGVGLHESQENSLYVTRIETGSLVVELAPYVLMMGTVLNWMNGAVIVNEFVKLMRETIERFADPTDAAELDPRLAEYVQAVLKPLSGRSKAAMRIGHAKIRIKDGSREIVAEYVFNEQQIDQAGTRALSVVTSTSAATLIEQSRLNAERISTAPPATSVTVENGVVMYLPVVNSGLGKLKGRPVLDRGVVPSLSGNLLPVEFRAPDIKTQMVKQVNPHTNAFYVDIAVYWEDEQPKHYTVTHVHGVVPPATGTGLLSI